VEADRREKKIATASKSPAKCEELLKNLRQAAVRLSTFKNWPVRFGYLDPRELANAGFFYYNQDCAVQCAFCLGIIEDWTPADMPMREHRHVFPRCPFVIGLDVGNVPMDPVTLRDQDMTEVDREVEKMVDEFKRRMSLQNKPLADSGYRSSSDKDWDTSSCDENMSESDKDEKHHTVSHGDDVCG
jgi:hypothetical protein